MHSVAVAWQWRGIVKLSLGKQSKVAKTFFESEVRNTKRRYYSPERPIAPGTFPKSAEPCEVVNFEKRQFVEKLGCWCYGYISTDKVLTKEEMYEYELIKAPTAVRKNANSLNISTKEKQE